MPDQSAFLLVEDDSNDVLLVKRAFLRARVLNPLHVVKSGEEAIAYLGGLGKYANRFEYPLPNLILLDIQMPGMDGFEVLKWVRAQPGLREVRVVMLTSSDTMRDMSLAYQLGASSFLVKPVDFQRLVEISQALGGSWLWRDQELGGLQPGESKLSSDTEILRKVNVTVASGV